MPSVTEALSHARALALGRLEQEAQRVGADAVVGVQLTQRKYEWAPGLLEFRALGTAVRSQRARARARPVLTNLSGQDLWKLGPAGSRPRGRRQRLLRLRRRPALAVDEPRLHGAAPLHDRP